MKGNRFLNSLVQDCITYNLSEVESLEYIKTRYGKPISRTSFCRRKSHVLSDNSANRWLSHYTRIGFVKGHIENVETIRKIRDDSMRQLQIEQDKKVRDERKILALKDSIMESTKLLSELNLGTPIVAGIKAKLQTKENEKRISISE